MKFLKNLPLLFILLTFFPRIYAFDVDELLDGDGLANGFTHFLRIGIKTDVSSFSLEGDAEILDKNDKVLGTIQGRFQISAESGGIRVGGKVFKVNMIKFTSELLPLKVEGRMFRGEIEIHLKNSKLIVVNKLDIEDYVKGVINKEAIPSWPVEAKKTQAVLARTFAVYQKMFNPRSEFFDLAPTVLDQVYDGLGKEDVSSVEAVDATKGEVITIGSDPAKIYFHSTCGNLKKGGAASSAADMPLLHEVFALPLD